jgi:hypothetical protein
MKPPKPKIHLMDVSEPLLCFSGLVMRCGAVLHSAEMVYARAVGEPVDVNRIGYCTECLMKPPSGEAKRTYEYGLREKEKKGETESE